MGEARSHEEMLARIAVDSLNSAPGEGFCYTNSGYYLLGLLIEERTGCSYAEALLGRLLDPIGLPQKQYCPDVPATAMHARGDRPSPFSGTLQRASAISMPQPFAAGASCASAPEMLAWMTPLRSGNVLSDTLYAATRTLNDHRNR